MTYGTEREGARTGTGGQEGTTGRATAGPRRLAAAADPEEMDGLMKVCEWEHVQCPYCGEDTALSEAGLVSVKGIEPGAVERPGHEMYCLKCNGAFVVPCED